MTYQYQMLILIAPINSQQIATAIFRYWKLYRELPLYIKIIDRTHYKITDVKKTLRQIKDERNNSKVEKVVASIWSETTFNVSRKYTKSRKLHQ